MVPSIPQPDDPTIRHVPLTKGYVAIVDTGVFEQVNQFNWSACVTRRKDGSIKNVYARRTEYIGNVKIAKVLHRVILGVTDLGVQVDHRDHDGLNCRRSNLRVATQTQNMGNRRMNRNNTSGFKGVSLEKESGKFRASGSIGGACVNLGRFNSAEDAAKRYDAFALEYFGEFAYLNFG